MARLYLEKLSKRLISLEIDVANNALLECRHFFSGAALYVNQKICITLTPVGLALKLPESTSEELMRTKQAVPLRYFQSGPVKKNYALVTASLDSDDTNLSKLIRESIEYVLSQSISSNKNSKDISD